MMPQVGDKYRVNFGKGHPANKLLHIRSIVDDEYVVYRFWRRGYWMCKITDPTFFEVGLESGHLHCIYKEKNHEG